MTNQLFSVIFFESQFDDLRGPDYITHSMGTLCTMRFACNTQYDFFKGDLDSSIVIAAYVQEMRRLFTSDLGFPNTPQELTKRSDPLPKTGHLAVYSLT